LLSRFFGDDCCFCDLNGSNASDCSKVLRLCDWVRLIETFLNKIRKGAVVFRVKSSLLRIGLTDWIAFQFSI